MLYLPTSKYLKRFSSLSYPLPPKLLPWLYKRGLAIYVLPKSRKKAIKLVSSVMGSSITGETTFDGDPRTVVDTAHFSIKKNIIFIPHASFYCTRGENVLLHELGHAIDFNYTSVRGQAISNHHVVWDALRVDNQLNKYCEDKLDKTGFQLEQFACSFVAFFQEPDNSTPGRVSTIDDLSPELVRFFKTNIMDHFQ